jgi:hypothetical protein
MSINFYNEFAVFLKFSRERAGISLEDIARITRINITYLELMEKGVFDFASSVLIQGYLRKYAQVIGINQETLGKQYNMILRKIDYVSSEHHLPPSFLEFKSTTAPKAYWPTVSIWKKEWWEHYARIFKTDTDITNEPAEHPDLPKDDTQTIRLKSTSQALDEEVHKKWRAEQRVTNMITGFAMMMILISAVFYFSNPGTSASWQATMDIPDRDITTPADPALKNAAGLKRVRLDLTAPLYSNPERSNDTAVLNWLAADSIKALQNLKNQILKKNDRLIPVSVHDIAKTGND